MTSEAGTARRPVGWRRALRDPVVVIALVVLTLGIAQMLLGALRVGVTWDEPMHVGRTRAYLSTGWFVPWSEQEETGEIAELRRYVYGPAASLLAHAGNVVAGFEQPGELEVTSRAYGGRHLVMAGLGALTALTVGLAGWVLTRSRRIGLWTAAALTALPSWTGHAMFNIKDLPAATGYTLVTVGLALALVEHPPDRLARWRPALVVAAVAAGIVLGFGTRLAFWVPLGIAVLAALVLWALGWRTHGRVWRRAPLAVIGGALAGLAGTVAIYPRVFADPLALVVGSVRASSAFPWGGSTLTAGRVLPAQELPWWYLPAWLGARLPLLLGALTVAGVVLVLATTLRGRRPEHPADTGFTRFVPDGATGGWLLVVLQATMLSGGAVVLGAVMYDGIRQHLYVVPALALLAGLAAHRLVAHAHRSGQRWRRAVVTGVLSIALVVPLAEQLLLFPFNYTYVNAVAGIGGINGRWETDYWRAAGHEAITRVPAGEQVLCTALERPGSDSPAGFWECGPKVSTFAFRQGSRAVEHPDAPDGVWVIGPIRRERVPPDICTPMDDVTRWVRGEQVLMMRVMICELDEL